MAIVSKNYLLEAGVHFGHQTKRWNPKMKEYIFAARDDIYIIDLAKTVEKMEEAYAELKELATDGKVLFVGTKKQSQEVSKEEALRSGSYYVIERWLGGTLTNFRTIRARVTRLIEIENMERDGKFELLPKKEVSKIKKEYEKLNKLLSGIREMTKLPKAMIVTDPKNDYSAIREARILKIPVFGIVDTNCDPDDVDFVIPANDDAVRSVKLVLGVLANAICEANNLPLVDYVGTEEDVRPERKKKEIKKEVKEEKVEVVKEEKTEEKKDYSKMTVTELKKIAKDQKVKGYSTMKKDELVKVLK